MQYSGLYRCSGCSVTFSDPVAWREGPAEPAATAAEVAEAPTKRSGSPEAVHNTHLFATWGQVRTGVLDPTAFGYNEDDYRAIKEAADRATRSKGRRR